MNPTNAGGGSLFKVTYCFKEKGRSMKNELALELMRIEARDQQHLVVLRSTHLDLFIFLT